VNWSGGWTEIGDNAALGGDTTIASNALNFNTGVASGDSVSRAVDLDGATSATLSFNWRESGASPGENILVKAFNGASWETIGTLAATNGNASGDVSITLTSSQIGAHTAIRFEYSEGANGSLENSENFYVDNVRIDFTKPVDDAGDVNYSASFTENGPATAIATNPGITDDGTTIASARIILTNAKPGDILHENGVGGDGISGSIANAGGTITLTLTGVASLSAYQAAIARVTFENTSDTPDTEPRVIKVTVNDGQVDSNVATATINVTPVNDAPSVGDDYVVSNSVTTIVPEWTLLANDSDADGPNPLALTGLTSGLSGLASASRATNPGSVTIVDNNTPGGSLTYTATDGLANGTASVTFTRQSGTTVEGNNSLLSGNRDEILVGGSGSETLIGHRGDDIVLAGGGDDTIVWNVTNPFLIFPEVQDGRDFVDGGTGTDTFTVNGNSTAETFRVYARADAEGAGFGILNADTEIVITRNGTVIAELNDIEEIVVNTGSGGGTGGNAGNDGDQVDTVAVLGDFSGTSLNYSTITINGDEGDDTVDISELTSDHRIVFHGAGGTNRVIGNLRPQDVFDGANGSGGPVLPPSQGDQGGDDDGDEDDQVGSGGADDTPAIGGNDVGSGGPDPRPSPGGDDPAGHDQSDHPGSGGDGRAGGPSNGVVDGGHRDRGVFSGDAAEYHFTLRGGKVVVSDRVAGRDGIDTLSGGEKVRFDDDSFVLRAGDNHGRHVWGSNSKSDVLLGFGGNDVLDGGRKADVLVGGSGKDRFVFDDWDTGVGEGRRDTILDFKHGQDRLDLRPIDANHARHGDQRFHFTGTHDFTGAQQVRYEHVDTNGDGVVDSTLVQGNVNADLGADFEIMLKGYLGPLHAHDILF
jgi:Ca2+-binding RTX toxin-like protein